MARRKRQDSGDWLIAGQRLWDRVAGRFPTSEPADYKPFVMALLLVRQASEAFEQRRAVLSRELADPGSERFQVREDIRQYFLDLRDSYAEAGVFYVTETAAWKTIIRSATNSLIGGIVEEAVRRLETDNDSLAGILPKGFVGRFPDHRALGGLLDDINAISKTNAPGGLAEGDDIIVRAFDYFLPRFAEAERAEKDRSLTPPSVASLIVECAMPTHGVVYDPCFGSGGLLAAAVGYASARGGSMVAVGQELKESSWRVGCMNMAIRGVESRLGPKYADTFHEDLHPGFEADFVFANPEFNQEDWGRHGLEHDVRWRFGTPPANNANFAWIQHVLSKLAPRGLGVVIMAKGSLTGAEGGESGIRTRIVEGGLLTA